MQSPWRIATQGRRPIEMTCHAACTPHDRACMHVRAPQCARQESMQQQFMGRRVSDRRLSLFDGGWIDKQKRADICRRNTDERGKRAMVDGKGSRHARALCGCATNQHGVSPRLPVRRYLAHNQGRALAKH